MHESVLAFIQEHIESEEVAGKRVLEIGSRNINGSVRPIISAMNPLSYEGIDRKAGFGVDIIEDWGGDGWVSRIVKYSEKYDLVISTEMLEHAEDWRSALYCMKYALKPATGILILTTRSPGFNLHDLPDYWRFTLENFRAMFEDMDIVTLQMDPQVPGVFIKARANERTGKDPVSLEKITVASAM
jgi:hypothetical protein